MDGHAPKGTAKSPGETPEDTGTPRLAVSAVSKGARKAVTVLTKGCASNRKEKTFENKAPKVPKLGKKKKKPKWKLQAEVETPS